ncbi:MAG: glycosyl transferase group 1 [Gemmatimonadetes bacterium]|nr:glycosyl transferase group 1 [Gemmatimonadota bacterium]
MSGARINVLHCCYDDPDNPWVGGGGARRIFELYRHLLDTVDVTIATGAYPGAREGRFHGLGVLRLGNGRTYFGSRLTYVAAASQLLRTAHYDVAIVDHSAYAPVMIPSGRPVGMTVHHLTGPVARERWGRLGGAALARVERATLRRARVLSATSSATEQALRAILAPDVRIARVSSGVADEFFGLVRHEADYVAYVGRLDAVQKGLDVLLDAWALFCRSNLTTHLFIAGRGPHERILRAQAERLGLDTRVTFLGALANDARNTLLAGAACQVMPSRFEGFGIVAAEALAAGVPLIVSDDPSLREIVGGPDAGVVVPRGDVDALAGALQRLLLDGAGRIRLSARGKARAEQFRWRVVADAHIEYLHSIIAAGGRSGYQSRA